MRDEELEEVLTWEQVHQWTAMQSPYKSLGNPLASEGNPITRFLQEQLGGQWRIDGCLRRYQGGCEAEHPTPWWVEAALDGATADNVTAAQFLDMLEQTKPRTD